MNEKTLYCQVVPDSHSWEDFEMLIRWVEGQGEKIDAKYLLTGLKNSLPDKRLVDKFISEADKLQEIIKAKDERISFLLDKIVEITSALLAIKPFTHATPNNSNETLE